MNFAVHVLSQIFGGDLKGVLVEKDFIGFACELCGSVARMENCSDSFNSFVFAVVCCASGDSDLPLIGDDYVSVSFVTKLTL